MKLLFICIDGMEFSYSRRIATILKLNYNNLISLSHGYNYSGPAWTSIYTGVTPQEHGVVSIWGHEINNKTTIVCNKAKTSKGYSNLEYPCLWDYLNRGELSCGLYGPPMTFPVRQNKNWAVAGFCRSLVANDAALYYKIDKITECNMDIIEDLSSFSTASNKIRDWTKSNNVINFEKAMILADEAFKKRFNYLIEKILPINNVDCLFISIEVFDRMGHLYGLTKERGILVADFVSKWMDYLISNISPEVVFAVSDHGLIGTQHTYTGGVISNLGNLPSSVLEVKDYIINHFGIENKATIAPLNDVVFENKEDEKIEEILKSLGYL